MNPRKPLLARRGWVVVVWAFWGELLAAFMEHAEGKAGGYAMVGGRAGSGGTGERAKSVGVKSKRRKQ